MRLDIKHTRFPAVETVKRFNSTVYKRIIYDTSCYKVNEEFIVKQDTLPQEILSQVAKVHSGGNINGNKTIANFKLLANTVARRYYIVVDQAGQQAFESAVGSLASSVKAISNNLVGNNPMIALALGLTSYLPKIQAGEDVDYYLTDAQNANMFMNGQSFNLYKQGKVLNDFSKMNYIPGSLTFCFQNDNAITGITAMVKVSAVTVDTIWNTREVTKMTIESREEMYLKN